jgi:polysaccharide export outer membrane protein
MMTPRPRSLCLEVVVALGLAGVLSACATDHAFEPPPPPESVPYRVGPPDQLLITILPDPPIERTATVRPDGMISIDLVGDVPAAGRTTEEIAGDIQERIARFKRDAAVNVSLSASLSTEVTLIGEIRNVTFPLQRETRLVEAIGIAGGVGRLANKDQIRIIRVEDGKTQILTANLDGIEHGDLSTNYLLRGGDIIVVPPTSLAQAGYWVQGVFFPFQQILGIGSSVGATVATGGMSNAMGAMLPRP